MPNAAQPRHNMIDGQLEPGRVLDPAIVAAMGVVRRELFVPDAYRDCAYIDEAIPLGHERFMLPPLVLGHLLQALKPKPGQKVLVAGAATGYGAAVLYHMGCEVYALEESQELANRARQILAGQGLSAIQVHTSALQAGLPAAAPYARILIEGGTMRRPDALAQQLESGGRLSYVAIREKLPVRHSGYGFVTVLAQSEHGLIETAGEGMAAPILPGMEEKEGFTF